MQSKQTNQSQSNNAQFVFLTKEQAYQSSALIFQANKDTNPHLIHGHTSEQQFKQQNIRMIDQCFQIAEKHNQTAKKNTHFCYGLKMDGKIVAIMLAIELRQFYSSIQHLINLVDFYHQFKYLKIEEMAQGTAVYCARLSVSPQLQGKGLGKRISYSALKYLISEGYQLALIGSVAKPLFQIFEKNGCIIQKNVEAVRANYTYQTCVFKVPFKAIMQKLQTEYALKSAKP